MGPQDELFRAELARRGEYGRTKTARALRQRTLGRRRRFREEAPTRSVVRAA